MTDLGAANARRIRPRASLCLAMFLACAGGSSALETSHAGRSPSGKNSGLRLVIEHLPPVVYYSETLPVCLRATNPGDEEIECTFEVKLAPPEGASDCPDDPEPVTRTAPPEAKRKGETTSAAFDLPARGWETATISLSARGAACASVRIRRFDERDKIPPLEARGERLCVAGGSEAAVLSLPQRIRLPNREWYFLKEITRRLTEGALPAGVIVLGARLSPAGEGKKAPAGAPPYLRAVRKRAGIWVEAVSLPGATRSGPVHPILGDIAAALEAMENARRAELVIWVVACDDARRATPVRVVRKCADFLLSRARQRHDAARVEILFVPEPAVAKKRRALYVQELEGAARAYRAGFTVAESLEDHDCWRVEGVSGAGKALGRYPNARGQEALAEAVLGIIRP